MSAKKSSESGADILALPLTVEGIDDSDLEGYVPLHILRDGTRIGIPYWPGPLPNDELQVLLRRNGSSIEIFSGFYDPPQEPMLYVPLTPEDLAPDGVAFLSYIVWKGAGGNDDTSPERKLTIDHTPLLVLEEPCFPHATLWGYLNNNTIPSLTCGVTVAVPGSKGIAIPGDRVKVHWQGYLSLNGSGAPVANTYGAFDKTLQQQDIDNGYKQVVPFDPHIKPLIDNDSALVYWQLFRNGRLRGQSKKVSAKIDRVTPGESGPFGLNAQGETKMTMKTVPKKVRPESIGVEEAGPLSAITIDTLADGLIAKSVLDSGMLTLKFVRTPEEFDADDFDVYYGIKGTTLIQHSDTFEVGNPVKDRPPVNIPFQLPASLFQEAPTPAEPTVYEVYIKLFKGGGGNAEVSNTLEFVIDQTAPFNTKNPRREVRPTPAPVFVNKPGDPQVTVNEAWMTAAANTNVNLTVNVGYPLRRLDDKVRVSLRAGSQSVEVWNNVVPATGAISFPSSVLRQFPNGRINIVQQYEDLPGNVGPESAPVAFLTLALAQKPIAKNPPRVPKTDPDYTTALYLDDLAGQIFAIVESAFIEHAETGDKIFVTIDDANDEAIFVELPAQDWSGANLNFELTYADLSKIFDNADDPKTVRIWYTITRPGMTDDVESPIANFTLAFDYAGPVNPDLPDLNNRALQLPVVTGDSGTPNNLLPGDRDKVGKFKVTLALTDPDITPEQTAKCYINGVFIKDYVPFVAESSFEVDIPVSIIAALPTPDVQAHWTIQKSGIDKNVMVSRKQAVAVGGFPIPLPLPTVRIRNPDKRPYIECYAMISPTSGYSLGLQIPKDPLLTPGKIITAHFEAHRNAAATDLIAGTKVSQDYTIKAANEPDVAPVGSTIAVFKAAQPVRGAVAYGKYWYTTDIGGTQSSVPVIRLIDTISSSFFYCDSTVAPAAAP